jgi:hypothetical protein
MGNQLAVIEPLRLPDQRRPAQIPSLPEWVVSRLETLKENWQRDLETGKTSQILTLPTNLCLTDTERAMVLRHISDLGTLVEKTPENDADSEGATLVIVTKMLLALPGQKSSDTGNEAKGEAYLAALDDVPPWAVQEAVRKWYRGEHGSKFDYRWSPVPADLRSLARNEEFKVRGRMTVLERICKAVPLIEFSDDHREMMLKRLQEVVKPPMSINSTNKSGEKIDMPTSEAAE